MKKLFLVLGLFIIMILLSGCKQYDEIEFDIKSTDLITLTESLGSTYAVLNYYAFDKDCYLFLTESGNYILKDGEMQTLEEYFELEMITFKSYIEEEDALIFIGRNSIFITDLSFNIINSIVDAKIISTKVYYDNGYIINFDQSYNGSYIYILDMNLEEVSYNEIFYLYNEYDYENNTYNLYFMSDQESENISIIENGQIISIFEDRDIINYSYEFLNGNIYAYEVLTQDSYRLIGYVDGLVIESEITYTLENTYVNYGYLIVYTGETIDIYNEDLQRIHIIDNAQGMYLRFVNENRFGIYDFDNFYLYDENGDLLVEIPIGVTQYFDQVRQIGDKIFVFSDEGAAYYIQDNISYPIIEALYNYDLNCVNYIKDDVLYVEFEDETIVINNEDIIALIDSTTDMDGLVVVGRDALAYLHYLDTETYFITIYDFDYNVIVEGYLIGYYFDNINCETQFIINKVGNELIEITIK